MDAMNFGLQVVVVFNHYFTSFVISLGNAFLMFCFVVFEYYTHGKLNVN